MSFAKKVAAAYDRIVPKSARAPQFGPGGFARRPGHRLVLVPIRAGDVARDAGEAAIAHAAKLGAVAGEMFLSQARHLGSSRGHHVFEVPMVEVRP